MNNLKIFCVTNLPSSKLEKLNLTLAGVGKNDFSNNYINCKNGDNIEFKEQYYSELTFHYWFWKNKLAEYSDDIWIGFCQKRRFWLKDNKDKTLFAWSPSSTSPLPCLLFFDWAARCSFFGK